MCVSMELVTAVLGDHGQRPRDDYGRASFVFLRGRVIVSLVLIHYSSTFVILTQVFMGCVKLFCVNTYCSIYLSLSYGFLCFLLFLAFST